MTRRPRLPSLVTAVVGALLVTLVVPAGAALAGAAPQPPRPAGRAPAARTLVHIPPARVALARAEAVARAMAGPATGSTTRAPKDATLVLRDLAARLPELHGAARRTAQAILARPDGGNTGVETQIGAKWSGPEASASPECAPAPTATREICVHWTDSGADAPPKTDGDANGYPDQVDLTLQTMLDVWTEEVTTLGYRPPLTDQRASIDNDGPKFDVYLSDIGGGGYYGYCAIDDHRSKSYAYNDRAGYCVLDDDYSSNQFPTNTPQENLQVTAAHEFFHAVQFGYDAFEDRWMMESTAAWVEDVAYPAVNDNLQYLPTGPMGRPLAPLDKGRGGFVYGSWIFFRYLSDRFGSDDIVRRIWEFADDSPHQLSTNNLKTYSLAAVDQALREQGTGLRSVFADFAAANTTPTGFYTDGILYQPANAQVLVVKSAKPSTGVWAVSLDHLTSLPAVVRPGTGVSSTSRLRVRIDGPSRAAMPQARLVIRYVGAKPKIVPISLDRSGFGSRTVAFGSGTVKSVVVVPVNASSRYQQCFTRSWLRGGSCRGYPTDDGRRFLFEARLL